MSGDGGQGFRARDGLAIAGTVIGAVLLVTLGKNCSSGEPGCEYIPGSGSALVSSGLTAAVVGWLTFRVAGPAPRRRLPGNGPG
jgi:hypothetical protein